MLVYVLGRIKEGEEEFSYLSRCREREEEGLANVYETPKLHEARWWEDLSAAQKFLRERGLDKSGFIVLKLTGSLNKVT